MLWNTIVLALRAIRRNLLRSFLTVLGVVIGVAAVITMVTLGNGATRSVSDQISSMGSNLLIVVPGQRFGPGGDGAPAFKREDAEAIHAQVGAARLVAPVVSKSITAVYLANNWSTVVSGTNDDYFEAGNWEVAEGRVFSDAEERAGKSVCVLGETVRDKLFGGQNPVGSEIRVKDFACEVIGLLKSKGQSAMGNDQDDVVIMPLRTVQRRISGTTDVNRVMVSVSSGASIDSTKDQITSLMRERRKIGDDEDDDFRVMDTRQITQTLTSTTRILTGLLAAVAAVSLLVGGIGIMNIMLVSVTERTREIGLRMAIGAKPHHVRRQFLIEAVVLSLAGGLLGIAFGFAAGKYMALRFGFPLLVRPDVVVLAVAVSAAVGIGFGLYPAHRASRLDPIVALRHE